MVPVRGEAPGFGATPNATGLSPARSMVRFSWTGVPEYSQTPASPDCVTVVRRHPPCVESTVRSRKLFALMTAVLSTVGCHATAHPIDLTASPSDRESLVGTWTGSYTVDRLRDGRIDFTLQASNAEAVGDVLMIPRGAHGPYGPLSPEGRARGDESFVAPEVLTIRFARAEDGRLTGALTPYWDPDRRCLATATFRGELAGAALSGTFVSVCDVPAPTYTGRWQMHRRT